MPAPDFTAGTVMDTAAALLNDAAKSNFTYAAQLPYLNLALKELEEMFELEGASTTDQTSSELTIPANTSLLAYNTTPALPSDMIEPQLLWERTTQSEGYVPMTKKDFLPRELEGAQINQLLIWVWATNQIKFIAANSIVYLKIDYTRYLFTPAVDQNSQLAMINAQTFLEFRTAGLCAEFIGENPTRAVTLNSSAGAAIERSLGINTKGRQAIMTRRRPFRNSFKQRFSV